ncbi:MAG: ABC transporter permease [Verrucomicrobia bacterium]|nr:ABC transporter permease [Verrucomicrobiota bacterium]MDA1046463.1 ABC transporter permease [Verrucomicrobiota bacterium]
MFRFLIGRLLQGLLVLFALYTITFFLAKAMPGEPFTSEKNVSAETKANIRKLYGLDKPLWEQYYIYPKNIITEGSFGISTSKGRPVRDIIEQSFPNSLLLGLCALCFAVGIGVPIGVLSAVRRNSWVDWTCMAVAMVGICVPSFTIGPLLQIYVATHVPGLKVAGWGSPQDVLLPAFTLGLVSAAYLARLTRGGILEVLSQDFVRTARAKGLSPARVIIKHSLRGGLIPAVAYLGPAFAALISGSFIVETIFQVPGMGQHFVNAATTRDEFLLLGVSLFFGFLIVVMNLLADILTGLLDPRVRIAGNAD